MLKKIEWNEIKTFFQSETKKVAGKFINTHS